MPLEVKVVVPFPVSAPLTTRLDAFVPAARLTMIVSAAPAFHVRLALFAISVPPPEPL